MWGEMGLAGVGEGGRAPRTSLSPAPSPSCPIPHYSGEEGSPQPAGASEGPEGWGVATQARPQLPHLTRISAYSASSSVRV